MAATAHSCSAWFLPLMGSDVANKIELSTVSLVALCTIELAIRIEGIVVRDLESGFALLTLRIKILHTGSLEPLVTRFDYLF